MANFLDPGDIGRPHSHVLSLANSYLADSVSAEARERGKICNTCNPAYCIQLLNRLMVIHGDATILAVQTVVMMVGQIAHAAICYATEDLQCYVSCLW